MKVLKFKDFVNEAQYVPEKEIVRNKNKNDWKSMFDFYLEYNDGYLGKGNLMQMAYGNTTGIDSAIPQQLWSTVDSTSFYVYDYKDSTFGKLVDLREKLKFSNVPVDITIVVGGEALHGGSLPEELSNNLTFSKALSYVFNHDDVEEFSIRPKTN